MLKLSKKENSIVIIGRVKIHMDNNNIDGSEDFVRECLGETKENVLKVARKYLPNVEITS